MGVITNFSWVILLFFLTVHSFAAEQGDTDMNTAIEIGNVDAKIRIGIAKAPC